MRYQTLSEYFYKLYATLFLIVLMPLGVFVVMYGAAQMNKLKHPLAGWEESDVVVYAVVGLVLVDWTISAMLFRRSLQAARTLVSLGDRLDKYYFITVVRFVMMGGGLLGLSAGYYLVGDQLLTALFIGCLLALGLFWPFPARVSRHLALKEDERRVLNDWK